jgi:hypothetical protein
MAVRNLARIRDIPEYGKYLYEALRDLVKQDTILADQTNSSLTGTPQPPGAVNSLSVTAQDGHFNVAITDQNQINRGVQYFVEHADNPQFTNPVIEHIGTTRNANFFLGDVTRYWRAYSAYPGSNPGPPAYHGGAVQPLPVRGGGPLNGPAFQPSQGSGTGAPGEWTTTTHR